MDETFIAGEKNKTKLLNRKQLKKNVTIRNTIQRYEKKRKRDPVPDSTKKSIKHTSIKYHINIKNISNTLKCQRQQSATYAMNFNKTDQKSRAVAIRSALNAVYHSGCN